MVVGIDRSAAMLARAATDAAAPRQAAEDRAGPRRHPAPALCRAGSFPLVIAPYGILQSLLRERDLAARSTAVAAVLAPGGVFGLELVADLPAWQEYTKRVSLRGRRANGTRITLIESVRQDRATQADVLRTGIRRAPGPRGDAASSSRCRFAPLSVPQMARAAGEGRPRGDRLLGDYRGGPWDSRAEAWIILAQPR